MIEEIRYKKKILGLIINHKKNDKKVNFYTPNNFTQQVGFIEHNKDTYIKPHTHNIFLRKIYKTAEVLIVNKGKIELIFIYQKKNIFLVKL